MNIVWRSVKDPHHFDSSPDPVPAFHFDADPDPTTHFSQIWTLRCSIIYL
jgi:hypothetical protein